MSKLVLRPLPDQRKFEEEYFDFLVSLPEKIDRAFKKTSQELRPKHPLSVGRSWFANTMNGNLICEIGTSYPEFLKYTGRGSYCLMFNSKYEGYVKKLSRNNFRPSYNHSISSRALTEQKAFSDNDALPVVYIGYTINKTNDLITGYYAVCIKGNKRIWKTDLTCIEVPGIKTVDMEQTKSNPNIVEVKIKPNVRKKTS